MIENKAARTIEWRSSLICSLLFSLSPVACVRYWIKLLVHKNYHLDRMKRKYLHYRGPLPRQRALEMVLTDANYLLRVLFLLRLSLSNRQSLGFLSLEVFFSQLKHRDVSRERSNEEASSTMKDDFCGIMHLPKIIVQLWKKGLIVLAQLHKETFVNTDVVLWCRRRFSWETSSHSSRISNLIVFKTVDMLY